MSSMLIDMAWPSPSAYVVHALQVQFFDLCANRPVASMA